MTYVCGKNFSIKIQSHAFLFLIAVTFLTSCMQNALELPSVTSEHINGYIEGYSSSSSSSTQKAHDISTLSCVSPLAHLYKLNPDGTRIEPALSTTVVESDGTYSFYTKETDIKFQGKTPKDPLIVQINGCNSGIYFRPITGSSNQNVTVGSTVVGFLLNTFSREKLASALINKPEEIEALLTQLSTAKSFTEAFGLFSNNQNIGARFTSTFGLAPNVLTQSSPEIVATSIPRTSSELVGTQLSVNATHFLASYQMAYEWRLNDTVIGTTRDLNFIPHANQQGTYTLKLKVGESDGTGAINLSLPTKELISTLVISNNVLPAAQSLRLAVPSVIGTTPINSRNITLSLNTGTNKENCASFSSLALTENVDAVPSEADFNISCTDSGSQNLNYSLATSGDGIKILRVWAKDASGVISATSANLIVYLDTGAPTVSINSGPLAITNSSTSTFTFSSNDSGGTIDHYECQLDSSSFTPCTSPMIYTNLSEGSYTFNVKSIDTAGNTSAVQSRSWIIDLTPPTLSLTALPNAVTNQLASTISFSATDSGGGAVANYYCNLDNGGFTACTSPFVNTLGAGSHLLLVKATDTAGNSSVPQSYNWVIDLASPTVNMSSQPASLTNSTSATFTFSGTDTGGGTITSYECQLDGGGYSVCSSPKNYTGLTASAHTFDVRAIDSATNVGIATRSNWTIDLTTPLASINSGPNALTNLTNATFTFSANSPPGGSITGYECKLDANSWSACSSPKSYTGLTSGAHSFSIRSVDNNSNLSAPSSYTWTIDTTAPALTITSTPQVLGNSSTAQFNFSATDSGGGVVSQFNCSLDSGSDTLCSSPLQYSGLPEGTHTISITALDTAGNTSSPQTYSWTVDLTAPTLTYTTTPNAVTKSSSASFTFSGGDTGGGTIASFKCSLDGQAYATCTSPVSRTGLAEGPHQFSVIALDTAGNFSTATTYSWLVDQTAPTINITSTPNSITNQTSATFNFSGTDTGGGTLSGFSCKIDSGSYVACTSPATYSGLSSGNHTFSIMATDSADNNSAATQVSWAIDLNPPTVAITSPASNGSVVLTSQLANYTLSGTCSETDQTLAISGAISTTASCSNGNWTKQIDLSSLADGTISISASQTDAAGNSATTTRTLVKDTVAPVISISTPIALQGGSSNSSVSWSLTESNMAAGAQFNVELFDGTSWASVGTKAANSGLNSNQTYTLTNFSTPAVNSSTAKIRISISDAAGQSATVTSNSFIIDSTPPVLSSVVINNGATYVGSALVNVQVGVSDALSGSSLSIKMAAATGAGDCQSQFVNSGWLAWTSSLQNFAFNISPVDGTKKICVWAKDAVGNYSIISPATGTAGVDYSTIIRQASNPPQMTGINVYNTSNSTNTYTLNAPVTITWSATAAGGLDNNPIALSYSTNGTSWFDIVTKADASVSSNITWLGGLSGSPTSGSGSYTSFTAPSSGYFIIKAIVRDVTGNMSVAVMSQPQNTGSWSIFAGSTDRGDNGSGLSATLSNDGKGGQPIAVNPLTNDIYALDHGYGLRKLDIQTGLVTTFIPHGTLNLPASGILTTSSRIHAGGASSMIINSKGIMYFLSYSINGAAKVYKINLATRQVDYYFGGGSANTAAATPSTMYVSAGVFDLDANDNLYFMTDCNTTSPSYLTPKKLMMLSQNADGSPGTFTEIAGGTCAFGAPTAGQPAATQPLASGSGYPALSGIAAINPNFIYFSTLGNTPIKIINGIVYSTNIGANSRAGVLTYNRATNRIYRSVAGLSFGYFTPNNSGNGGETFTTAAASNGTGDCVSDGVTNTLSCVSVDSGFAFDSNGLVYFSDGFISNSPNGYRIRYIDSSNKIRTILGSLPFYGEGLQKGLIRGSIGGIYYKKSNEANLSAFPAGLYLVSPNMVFGRINESDNVYSTLWGNQQGNNYAAPTGTTISSTVSMGFPYAPGNGKSLVFDKDGLPWMRASNQLIKVDANNKLVIKANATGAMWETNTNPSTASIYVFAGYQNLTLKDADGAFFIGGYYSPPGTPNPNPQIRYLDFTNNISTKVMGGSYTYSMATSMSVDITTPGGVAAAPLYYGCINSAACSIQYIASQDRLYFISPGDRNLRYITNPTNTASSTLTTMPTQVPNGYIINFIFKEDLSQVFLLDSRGGLYCMNISSSKSWCDNTTNLYPHAATMGTFGYGPNQMTWKDANTLLISNYKGQVLQYTLLP